MAIDFDMIEKIRTIHKELKITQIHQRQVAYPIHGNLSKWYPKDSKVEIIGKCQVRTEDELISVKKSYSYNSKKDCLITIESSNGCLVIEQL